MYRLESKAAFPPRPFRVDGEATAEGISHGGHIQEMVMKLTTLAGAAAASLLFATGALAGSCPADQQKADVRAAVSKTAKGVTDTVLAAADLGNETIAAKDRQLRFRKLTIEPGGIVPWHSHDDRPAIIFVQQGEIYEYASNCAVPILHKTGETRVEVKGTAHWWENTGSTAVILYVGDVLHDKHDHNM
jgi:quercetin dioxygenase-like cupin family protein